MFQLTKAETEECQRLKRLRSQFVTLMNARGTHRKYQPFAFTEYGILMLSSVLKSPRAVQVNIQIMCTFVGLREMLASNDSLLERLDELEEKFDAKFKIVFESAGVNHIDSLADGFGSDTFCSSLKARIGVSTTGATAIFVFRWRHPQLIPGVFPDESMQLPGSMS
jgi:hypothetical protein